MLIWESDKERILELTLRDSIPFLLFAPDEFRNELIVRLRGLYQSCNQRATDNFNAELRNINEMLKDSDFGEMVKIHIFDLQSKLRPFNQTINEHSIRLQELEKQVKKLNKCNKKKEEDIEETGKHKHQMSVPVSVPNNLPENLQEPGSVPVSVPNNLPNNLPEGVLSQAPVHKTDIIRNCLRNSETSLIVPELVDLTGLSTTSVSNALNNLSDRDKIHIKKEYVFRDGKYGNTVRNYRYVAYKWIEDPENNILNNDTESIYNDIEY